MQETQDTAAIIGILRSGDKSQLAKDKRRLNHDLGKVVRSWSMLHEHLAQLFREVTGLEAQLAYAIWHTLKADRSQREMLLSGIQALKAPLETRSINEGLDGGAVNTNEA